MATHRDLILDQFSRQALPFSAAAMINDKDALKMIVNAARPGPKDTVLDVACGPGLVVCAFAPYAGRVTGIDMTPAMLDRARRFAAEQGVRNVDWHQGDAYLLPYAAESFTIVVCLAVSGYLSQGPLFMSFALRYGTCSLGRSRIPATRSKSSRRSGRRRLMVASGSPFIFTVTTSMLPIVQRSLSLAHQFDFATSLGSGYWKFGARQTA